MSKWAKQIEYSEKYADDEYEYRHVHLPTDVYQIRKSWYRYKRLLEEDEWRTLGIRQSRGWQNYEVFDREPHVMLFRRPIPKAAMATGEAPVATEEQQDAVGKQQAAAKSQSSRVRDDCSSKQMLIKQQRPRTRDHCSSKQIAHQADDTQPRLRRCERFQSKKPAAGTLRRLVCKQRPPKAYPDRYLVGGKHTDAPHCHVEATGPIVVLALSRHCVLDRIGCARQVEASIPGSD